MTDKVLVAYATKAGSTQEVAEVVGEVLRETGAAVDVLPARQVRDLRPYRGVVLGSGVRMDKLFGDAVKFARRHGQALGRLPVAYFVVCLTMMNDTPANRQTVLGYLEPLRAIKEPVSMGLFGGRMEYARLNFLLRQFLSRASDEIPEGDWRDWEAIRAWAASIAPALR